MIWVEGLSVSKSLFSASNIPNNVAVKAFEQAELLILAITPEATRSSDGKLKTGFYRIAVEANVPILLVGIDYPNKRFDLGHFIDIETPEDQVFERVHDYFNTMEGRNAGFLGKPKRDVKK